MSDQGKFVGANAGPKLPGNEDSPGYAVSVVFEEPDGRRWGFAEVLEFDMTPDQVAERLNAMAALLKHASARHQPGTSGGA